MAPKIFASSKKIMFSMAIFSGQVNLWSKFLFAVDEFLIILKSFSRDFFVHMKKREKS